MKEYIKHLPHYLSLFGILFVGFLAFRFFSYDQNFQIATVVAVSASYVVWGVVHHLLHKDLGVEIFIEYLAVALVGLVAVLFLLIRL